MFVPANTHRLDLLPEVTPRTIKMNQKGFHEYPDVTLIRFGTWTPVIQDFFQTRNLNFPRTIN